MARINFELKSGIHERFMGQCAEDGRTVSDVLRVLVLNWTERRVREKQRLEGQEPESDGDENVEK